jgi:LAGLIDADG endonuclease
LIKNFRDYTPKYFGYNLIFKNRLYSQSNIVNEFSYYLTGLIEGDGSIITPKTIRSVKGKLNYPSIQIIFNLKDLPLALLIQKELGTGSLLKKKGVNAYILTINSYDGILLLIALINGKMRTPKIYSLYALIDFFNVFKNTNLEKKPLCNKCLVSNSWLSGFIDADGSFQVRTTERGKYTKYECKLEIVQRQIDYKGYNNIDFLRDIARIFDTEVKKIRMNISFPQYRVRTTNLKANILIKNYLLNYPLFSSKYLNFLD